MAGNRLGDAGATALAPSLGRLPRLREVFALDGNGLGPAGIEALHAAAACAAAAAAAAAAGVRGVRGGSAVAGEEEECMVL